MKNILTLSHTYILFRISFSRLLKIVPCSNCFNMSFILIYIVGFVDGIYLCTCFYLAAAAAAFLNTQLLLEDICNDTREIETILVGHCSCRIHLATASA